jgi:hypothetical protein
VSTKEKDIQTKYAELWVFDDQYFGNSKFKDYIMEGLLRKNVSEIKFF